MPRFRAALAIGGPGRRAGPDGGMATATSGRSACLHERV